MRRLLCAALAVFLFLSSISGCSVEKQGQKGKEKYKRYGINAEETKLTETAYSPQEETQEFMLKDLMQYMGNQKTEDAIGSLLPETVKINSYDLKENLLVIDFNKRYLKIPRVREVLIRAGIVKTFLQVPGVEKVHFLVEGEELCDSKKQPIGDMNALTFAEYDGYNLDTYRYDTFILYFADKTGKKLVEEKRSIYYKGDLSKEKVVLEQLAKGPIAKGNYPSVPEHTQVNQITIADGVCYVDLNSSFVKSYMEVQKEVTLYSIVNSLIANCAVEKVQISVDGEQEVLFGTELSLYQFYEMNQDLIKNSK